MGIGHARSRLYGMHFVSIEPPGIRSSWRHGMMASAVAMALPHPLDASPDDVRAFLAALRNDFSVALIAPGNAFAVGAVIRVAHSFLAREVFIVGHEPWYAKASMGMHKYETIHTVSDAGVLRRETAGRPVWVIEKDRANVSLYDVTRFPRDVVFVFGSERFGVPDALVTAADAVVAIPMYGVNHSLPVAVAAGIVMNEWARRHYAPGAVL